MRPKNRRTVVTSAGATCVALRYAVRCAQSCNWPLGTLKVSFRVRRLDVATPTLGRALLLGRRRRPAGMLRIALARRRMTRHPAEVAGLGDACRPTTDGYRGLLRRSPTRVTLAAPTTTSRSDCRLTDNLNAPIAWCRPPMWAAEAHLGRGAVQGSFARGLSSGTRLRSCALAAQLTCITAHTVCRSRKCLLRCPSPPRMRYVNRRLSSAQPFRCDRPGSTPITDQCPQV